MSDFMGIMSVSIIQKSVFKRYFRNAGNGSSLTLLNKSEVRNRGVTVVIVNGRRLERREVTEVASDDHSDIERVHGVSK